jgi:hypothetical protein
LIDRKQLYHFEAEIRNNPDMVLRMFIYGFEIGREHRDTNPAAEKTNGIVIRFPRAKIFYWAPNSKTPDKLSLTLIFPNGSPHEFIVETYKPLEHSIKELGEQRMALLLPFHVLKLRAAAKRTRTAADRRKLTADMAELMKALVEATKQSVRDKVLTEAERLDILDLMARLQKEIYSGYTEIEETTMEIVNGEIRTLSEQISDLTAGIALAKKQAKKQALAAEKRVLNMARNFKAMGDSIDKIAAATVAAWDSPRPGILVSSSTGGTPFSRSSRSRTSPARAITFLPFIPVLSSIANSSWSARTPGPSRHKRSLGRSASGSSRGLENSASAASRIPGCLLISG